MGWADKMREREGRPHRYVAYCDGVEIGSEADTTEVSMLAQRHAGQTLQWHKRPALWWAAHGDALYEIRRLKVPRDVGIKRDRPPRRHG